MTFGTDNLVIASAGQLGSVRTRRDFLRMLGVGGTVVLLPTVFAACSDDDDDGTGPSRGDVTIDLSNDTGVLNYAYALEQLEAAFYAEVITRASGSGLAAAELDVLTDIRDHEIAHRDFLRMALGGNRIGDLTPDFGAVNFGSRDSVLQTARTFEDLGVSAYNGAGKLLTSADFLTVAGKIVSVEARHAAAVRDLLNPGSRDFAGDDVVDPATGLDVAREPSEVISAADPFITNRITFTGI